MLEQSQQIDLRSIQLTSQDFASIDFKNIVNNYMKDFYEKDRHKYVQLNFKCCGYGYFPKFKQLMIQNFINFFKDAIQACTSLNSIQIIFNGFHVNEGNLLNYLIQIILQAIKKCKDLKILWLHTSHLRNCSQQNLINIFKIIQYFGIDGNREEISIQLNDWEFLQNQQRNEINEFQERYPSYRTLIKIFQNGIGSSQFLMPFKRFRLQISSWYREQKQAYKFLSETMQEGNNVVSYFQNIDRDKKRGLASSKLKGELTSQGKNNLEQFQKCMDKLALFVDFKPPVDKHKFYDQSKIQDLRQKQIDKKVNSQSKLKYDSHYNELLKRFSELEIKVTKNMVKYPKQFIKELRVAEFHKKMTTLLIGLLCKLSQIQDFQIDLRNWHPMFNIPNLKSKLDTTVSNKQEFSVIRRGLGMKSMIGRNLKQKQKVGLKTTYTM